MVRDGEYPYVVRMSSNNGQKGYINEDTQFTNEGNTISFGQDTATMFYQEAPYFTGDKIKILKAKNLKFNKNNVQFFLSTMAKAFNNFSWGGSSFNVDVIKKQIITLPTSNGEIDFDFMEAFVAEFKRFWLSNLEIFLKKSGSRDFNLTLKEKEALLEFNNLTWGTFNLENLFGKSTRGKRLKSADRIPGSLPFVTAGEANEGVSAFIGNNVRIFPANTITIDMFGSSKYRNYKYGADDHIAVVHTNKLNKYSSIFITSAIHKASHTGKFDYGRNFYAKDADELIISLPMVKGEPDYETIENVISAIHKQVVKKLMIFVDQCYEDINQVSKK